MSPVITFGGLLGEATQGRIVSTKNGSGQAFRPSEASHCVHLSHLFILVFEEFTHSTWLACPKTDLPQKVIAVENVGNPCEQEKMHSGGKKCLSCLIG